MLHRNHLRVSSAGNTAAQFSHCSAKLSSLHNSGVKPPNPYPSDRTTAMCSYQRVPVCVTVCMLSCIPRCAVSQSRANRAVFVSWGYGSKIIPCRLALIGSDRIVGSWLTAERTQDFPDPH